MKMICWCVVFMFLVICCVACLSIFCSSSSAPDLTVMTCNTGDLSAHKRPTSEKIIEAIGVSSAPDVILLQEVYGEEQARILARGQGMAHFAFSFYTGKSNGVAILSRYPLENSDTLHFAVSHTGYGAIAADIRVGKQTITVVSVHMDNVYWDMVEHRKAFKGGQVDVNVASAISFMKSEFWSDSTRKQSVQEFMEWLESRGCGTVIVGGDFNTVPLSRAVRAMGAHFSDVLWPSLHYWSGTYKRLSFPIMPRIDYLFYSKGVECLSSAIGSISPGDHYPVLAAFMISGSR
jgi:endonuclease/exonuclease/phosphatase (EEP) superfamily protein YafD